MSRKQKLTLNDKIDSNIAFMRYNSGLSNANDIEKMKKFVSVALNKSVTNMQRYCITEYYINNKLVKEIASELNVNSSTVTRHIQRGIKNIKKISNYINFYQ